MARLVRTHFEKYASIFVLKLAFKLLRCKMFRASFYDVGQCQTDVYLDMAVHLQGSERTVER